MKKLLATTLTLFGLLNVLGQNVSGVMKSKLRPDIKMHLARVEGSQILDVESTEIKPTGIFDFGDVNQPSGLYVLYTTIKSRNFEFIIHNEPEIKISILDSGFRNVEVEISDENKLYASYAKNKLNKSIKRNSLQKKLKNPNISVDEKRKINNQIAVLEKAFLSQTNEILTQSPESFSSFLIGGSFADNKSDKNLYFNDIDFNNENYIRTRILSERFREYIVKFSKADQFGYMNSIDDIMHKAKVNQKVYEFSAYEMLEGFYKSGMEELSNYILDEYIFAEACGGMKVGSILQNRGQQMKKLRIGNNPPNIVLKNIKQQTEDLYKTVAKNKYTLVMFWSSTCHSCESQMPMAKTLYSQYRTKGFEIFGMSLDLHASGWRKSVIDKKLNWINVGDFKGWDSEVADSYKIVKTPTFFLLDSAGKIVSKPRNIQEVSAILKKLDENGGF